MQTLGSGSVARHFLGGDKRTVATERSYIQIWKTNAKEMQQTFLYGKF